MNYYNTKTNQVMTETLVTMQGLPLDDKILKVAGLYPVEYNYPEYDKYTQKYVPKGEPHPKHDNPDVYVQDFEILKLDSETIKNILNRLKDESKLKVDEYTSNAIKNGFEATVTTSRGREVLHFSYDQFDQSNFTDTAIASSMSKASTASTLPATIQWNGYRGKDDKKELVIITLNPDSFLELYQQALVHKSTNMTKGGERKTLISNATTAKQVLDYMKEWDISYE